VYTWHKVLHGLQDFDAFRHDLLANTVTGNDCDAMGCHTFSFMTAS
jgi:hypothetical protein